MKTTDKDFLQWIHDRLAYVYGDPEQADYMHKLRGIIASCGNEEIHMFDDLRQHNKPDTKRPLPSVDPDLAIDGEDDKIPMRYKIILGFVVAFLLAVFFAVLSYSPTMDYSVKCYQQGIVIYNGDIRQYSSSSIYNNIETGARVILPQGSCVFTEILPQK